MVLCLLLAAAPALETLLPALARDDARIEQQMAAGGVLQTFDQSNLDQDGKVTRVSQGVLRFALKDGRLRAEQVSASLNGAALVPGKLSRKRATVARRQWLPMPSPFG